MVFAVKIKKKESVEYACIIRAKKAIRVIGAYKNFDKFYVFLIWFIAS